MATYKQLMAEKAALEAKLNEARAEEVAGVIAKIQELMADYGLSVEDIAGKRRRGRPATRGPVGDARLLGLARIPSVF